MLSRRTFILSASAAVLAGCNTTANQPVPAHNPAFAPTAPATRRIAPEYLQMYRAMPEEKFPIPAANLQKIDPVYYRQMVDYASAEPTGTIIVDTPNRFLYLTMENGKAMRYGVGIGRAGFGWGGSARIAYKRQWPTWTPPKEMIARQPETAQWANGMPPGLENPLGARALYIFEGNKDTLYRVHGTNEEWSIGKAVSSGCVRLLQQDIIDLYNRVPNNTRIVVYQEAQAYG
ncbi:lipoprotein-anchoring transpeptidase ErfK/SrfK [Roseibium hamelinense]|uniref:Lipoprotein-anchoring transpeptidase ErfK/SrfK n=1 Tax=Roseibium hamelinense TaxID=150831 RepID=A0A562TA76_9HYPH|nr:L,D-transpeptidase [Roseibium hamelinense]MTI45116.1 L,D-transpeptidase [Roseibium hamelinense]TWI90525.1 lipoprotein-anchoring transpeptidase ErfK/SrfK [Roseibium hamelinense]